MLKYAKIINIIISIISVRVLNIVVYLRGLNLKYQQACAHTHTFHMHI